jgi:hypothetical protein
VRDDGEAAYRFTVEVPNAWTRPWTAEAVLQTIEGPIVEHACHVGNYGIANTLAGVRLEEKLAAEEAAKKAAARAYQPAILRLANGRYACFFSGQPLPQGARAVSRWGTNQWRAYN